MPSSWKTIRVFISSTFKDMQAERDHLVRFVFPNLREKLLKHRIHFVNVDLRWGVTGVEDAGEVCREVIGECRPRFLCMLGGRYGWVPKDAEKSITADEIDFGVLHPPQNEHGPVRAFFYFRQEATTARMVEDKAGDYREPEGSDNATKLADLKKSIADAGHLPRSYGEDARWDAAAKRLVGLEKFGGSVHDDLLQRTRADPKLADRFTADTTKPPDEFQEEADQMDAFIEERTERYVIGSREALMRDMLAFAVADGTPNIFVLTGDPGSGKSALLAQFTRELSAIRHSSFHISSAPAPAPPTSAARSADSATTSPSPPATPSPCRSTSRNSSPISKSSSPKPRAGSASSSSSTRSTSSTPPTARIG